MNLISESDLDLLADYAAGVLERVAGERVARLIATDPAWATAYQRMMVALPEMSAALGALRVPDDGGAVPAADRMPPTVAARLDAALAKLSQDPTVGAVGDNTAGPTGWPATGAPRTIAKSAGAPRTTAKSAGAAGRSHPPAAPQDRRPRGRASATRRRSRILMLSTGGFAVVIAALLGLFVLFAPGKAGQHPNDSVAGGPGSPGLGRPTAIVTTSGFDYSHQTLAQALNPVVPGRSTGRAPQVGVAPDNTVRDGLTRLSNPVQRAACLDVVSRSTGGTPIRVDYARYSGRPALVIVLSGGQYRVLVVGPDCGLPNVGTAEIDHLS